MVSKLGLAARAYYRWAEVAILDASIPRSSYRNKINEVSEKYGIPSDDILNFLDRRCDRLWEKTCVWSTKQQS